MRTLTTFGIALALALPGRLPAQAAWPGLLWPRPIAAIDDTLLPRLHVAFASEHVSPPARTAAEQTEDGQRLLKSTVAPAVLITLGLFTFKDEGVLSRQNVRDWRNTFIPDFHDESDDLGQVLAGGLALGLNIAGVPGRHRLFRATTTYAVSIGVETAAIFTIKGLTEVRRPDGSSRNAFPSGHTAASFVSARFLDREYGHVSYLYSLTGYGIAAYTGVMRQLNNRHWLSDVLVGAGIGLLSTDLTYLAMDALFREKGVNPPRPPKAPGPRERPSFADFRIGYATYRGNLSDRSDISADDGWTAGGEAAFFFNRYLGVGGEISVAAFPINTENFVPTDPDLAVVSDELNSQPIGTQSVFLGPFVNVPLGPRWSVTGKVTGGWATGAIATVSARIKPEFQDEFGATDVPILVLDPKPSFGAMAGVSVRGRVSDRIALRVFGEYHVSKPDYQVRTADLDEAGNVTPGFLLDLVDVDFSYLALGAGVSVIIW